MPRRYTLTYGKFPCDVCGKVYSSLQALGGHRRVHPEAQKLEKLRRRRAGKLPEKARPPVAVDRSAPSMRLFCSSCGLSFDSTQRSDLYVHTREDHRRRPDAGELQPIRAVWDEDRVEWRADAG